MSLRKGDKRCMNTTDLGKKRSEVMSIMLEWLLVLRSALNITQEQIAYSVGISRQTYSAYELGKKELTWSTFLSLFLFFMLNEKSRNLLSKKPGYIYTVFILLNANVESFDIEELLQAGENNTESVEGIFNQKFN